MFHYHKPPINVTSMLCCNYFFSDKNSFLFIRNLWQKVHSTAHTYLSRHLNREGEIVATNDTQDCTELIDHQLAGDQASHRVLVTQGAPGSAQPAQVSGTISRQCPIKTVIIKAKLIVLTNQ